MTMKSFILFLLVLSSLTALPLRGQNAVLINEIMYHPNSTNVLEEYVELFNAGTNQVDLSGWRFTKGVQFTFPSNTFLAVSNYLVVAADRATFTNKYPGVTNFVAGWLGVLSDNGDEIQLEDALGQTVDNLSYAPEGDWAIRQIGVEGVPGAVDQYGKQGWEWFAEHDGRGKSLELINRNLSNHSGQNWASSTLSNGTPGRVNSVIRTNIAGLRNDRQMTDFQNHGRDVGADDGIHAAGRAVARGGRSSRSSRSIRQARLGMVRRTRRPGEIPRVD